MSIIPFLVRINDTVTFVEDGFDEDIEFGDEISDDDEDDVVDNVSFCIYILKLFYLKSFLQIFIF
jgi:hypothetical protein